MNFSKAMVSKASLSLPALALLLGTAPSQPPSRLMVDTRSAELAHARPPAFADSLAGSPPRAGAEVTGHCSPPPDELRFEMISAEDGSRPPAAAGRLQVCLAVYQPFEQRPFEERPFEER